MAFPEEIQENPRYSQEDDLDIEEDERDQTWDDWQDGDDDEDEKQGWLMCLFCDLEFATCGELFNHCRESHRFDFEMIKDELGLGFYGCFKLINYIRSQVACYTCWICHLQLHSNEELLNHLHIPDDVKNIKCVWDDEKYLHPFKEGDSLLYSFDGVEEYENCSVHANSQNPGADVVNDENSNVLKCSSCTGNERGSFTPSVEDSELASANLAIKHVKRANACYFESYSSFGIHKDMLSDKVRMDAYEKAILGNPSLFKAAVVMDLGCGTGILSFFSAQAEASRVLAVEASERMASVAAQIAEENGFLRINSSVNDNRFHHPVVEVFQGMIEELDEALNIEPNSVDVLLSEWMGYCLLYESMLSSVLLARDKWLKPGGAILPDIATIYAAGFGKENTSLAFWENVRGFDMSCVGKEIFRNAANFPVVDLVDGKHLVTFPEVLKTFDLATMKPDEMDFTATVELRPKVETETTWCYGVVLWFDTFFTSRFCKESPAVLSTSPESPKTHWCQTVFTFREPIPMAADCESADTTSLIDSDLPPAERIRLRISIVRAAVHRSIDISMEVTSLSSDGRRWPWPAQMFTLA